MNTIPIEVSGDVWFNPEQVKQALDQLPENTPAVLDFRAEGPSIQALGIQQVLDQWLEKRRYGPDMITVTCWSNSSEPIPYNKNLCSVPSHFWKMSRDYWIEPPVNISERVFGLFLGRSTVPRNVILYDTYNEFKNYFLFSKMSASHAENWANNTEELAAWTTDPGSVVDWYKDCPVQSIDQKSVKDQFGNVANHAVCNSSLLKNYSRFRIELVCETYTLGNTFFPTEKTVRPIMGGKPIFVYGPVNYLAGLREMGYKTYDSIWDESYDALQGAERWTAIKDVMHWITSLPITKREFMLGEAQYIAKYNRLHLQTFIQTCL